MENHPTGLLSSNTLTRDRAGSLDIVVLPEPSSVVNVMLHTVYGIPCNQYLASIAVLRATLHALVKYGLPPRTYLSRNAVLYALLLAQIPVFPLEVYTLAAEYNIHELAVAASACLIDLDIPSVSDETVTRMGVAYFMRLCALAQRRKDILRALIFVPPVVPAHRDGYIQCDGVAVTPAWSRAVADLVWEATPCAWLFVHTFLRRLSAAFPAISPERLRSAFSSFTSITCSYCRKCWATRVDEIVNAWSAAPVRQVIRAQKLCIYYISQRTI